MQVGKLKIDERHGSWLMEGEMTVMNLDKGEKDMPTGYTVREEPEPYLLDHLDEDFPLH